MGHFARDCCRPWGQHSGPPPAAAQAAEVHPHVGNNAPDIYYAEDSDRGFVSLNDSDSVLADSASVAEAVIQDNANTPGAEASSVRVEVVGIAPTIVVDEHLSQLDEISSQFSQSILPSCGPGGASSGGESSMSPQISQIIVSNAGNSNVVIKK